MKKVYKGRAVILLSGGVDSATTLAIAAGKGHELYAITFDYHQRHARELASARMTAAALQVREHLVVDFNLRDIGGSALTSGLKVPKQGLARNLQTKIPITYVPARNTIFLSFALAWAEVLNAENIYIGANAVDYSGYPDCRPEYIRAYEKMANLATKASVEGALHFRIRAPLISMTKAEIISKGTALGVDYGLTWSCYDPQVSSNPSVAGNRKKIRQKSGSGLSLSARDSSAVPCGRCDSCRLRAKGFSEAGLSDPLIS